ncbi:MAG: trypsin-like peptidase domain-containing protein [Microcoleus sp. CSU_2_2]|nr:trypsin-like peptidase domain-containing protein [Microcoleus sp. SU_5_3]NJS12179.1 trypsin-like peptidase domain-containing protein [Microcoleus sp. CSU_2_2]
MSSEKLENLIYLIAGRDKSRSYGTGFIIHKNESKRETYLMTCAHVIDDLGGADCVKVHNYDAEVVALGKRRGCDLAIVKVGQLLKGPLIRPCIVSNSVPLRLTIDGYHKDSANEYSTRRISSSLGTEECILDLEVWDISKKLILRVNDDNDFLLADGCSGSPVLVSASLKENIKKVIGVVYKMENNKKTGFAISIEEGKQICPPTILRELDPFWSYLSQSSRQVVTPLLKRLIKYAGNQIEKFRYQGQADSPELLRAFEWLSDRPNLAADAVGEVFNNIPDLMGGWLEDFDRDDFQWEIEKYIECIYVALIDDCIDALQELTIIPSQTHYAQAYEIALNYLKQNIPLDLDETISKKISEYLDCISQSISSNITKAK